MKSAIYRELGKKVAQHRKDKGLTQQELATAVDLSRGSVANLERGQQRIHVDTLVEIARVLGISPGDLLPREAVVQVDGRKLRRYSRQLQELIQRVAGGKQADG